MRSVYLPLEDAIRGVLPYSEGGLFREEVKENITDFV